MRFILSFVMCLYFCSLSFSQNDKEIIKIMEEAKEQVLKNKTLEHVNSHIYKDGFYYPDPNYKHIEPKYVSGSGHDGFILYLTLHQAWENNHGWIERDGKKYEVPKDKILKANDSYYFGTSAKSKP